MPEQQTKEYVVSMAEGAHPGPRVIVVDFPHKKHLFDRDKPETLSVTLKLTDEEAEWLINDPDYDVVEAAVDLSAKKKNGGANQQSIIPPPPSPTDGGVA